MKIQIIMPMAGEARRFNTRANDLVIKPLIQLHGKFLFEWALSSLDFSSLHFDLIFIIQKSHNQDGNFTRLLTERWPNSNVIEIDKKTKGPVETLLFSIDVINHEQPVIVLDCDLYFQSNSLVRFLHSPLSSCDTGVVCFKSEEPQYSYIKLRDDKILDIKEKEVISSNAVCGCYYFKSGELLSKLMNDVIQKSSNKELFLSDLIQQSIYLKESAKAFSAETHISLGTPVDISKNSHLLPLLKKERN